MFREGFEPNIPVLKRAKSVQTLDRAATVIGLLYVRLLNVFSHREGRAYIEIVRNKVLR
jgi:hypothetical protein